MGAETQMLVEPPKVLELLGGGGARESINMQGPLLAFNPIVEFFCGLWWNYQRVRIEKLRSL
jgi:hypothetical protein